MKFVELTDYHTNKKLLINLDKVFTIRNGHKSGFVRSNNTIIDFGNDQYIHVIDDYEDVKKIIKSPKKMSAKSVTSVKNPDIRHSAVFHNESVDLDEFLSFIIENYYFDYNFEN